MEQRKSRTLSAKSYRQTRGCAKLNCLEKKKMMLEKSAKTGLKSGIRSTKKF